MWGWPAFLREVPFQVVTQVGFQATIVVGIVALVSRLLGHASAALRSAVWLAGFAVLVLFPFVLKIAPFWNLPILPSLALEYDVARLFGSGSARECACPITSLGTLIVLVWGAGAVVLLGSLVASVVSLRRITRRAERVTAGPIAAAADLQARSTRRRRPAIVLTDAVPAPVVWGAFRPVILLPACAVDWTDGRLQAVLAHEFAHVRRGDWIAAIAMEIVRSAYWLNPLIWIAARRFRDAQEEACDDAVLRSGTSPVAYARHLLDIARSLLSAGPMPRAALPVARPSRLRNRVTRILDRRSDRRPAGPTGLVFALLLSAPLLSVIGGLNPWHCDEYVAERLGIAPPERP